MDITALLTAHTGVSKAGLAQAGGQLPADGAFAEQLSLAAHGEGLAQLLGDDAQAIRGKHQTSSEGELPPELAALANELAETNDQGEVLAVLESVLDEAASMQDKAPLAALEALFNEAAAAQRQVVDTVELSADEESALLAEVRQRMALIDAAGRPLTEPGQGMAKPQPGAEPAVLQTRASGQATATGQAGGELRPHSEALLLDPAAVREAKATGRDALAEITQQALRSVAQAAPAASHNGNSGASAQPGFSQPQPGSEAPLFAALSGRSEVPSAASSESQGILAPGAGSAQGTTASPQPLGQPLATPNGAALSAPVASQQWQQQLGQQLVNLTQRGDQRVELRLNPAELGPLSVSLKLGESGAQAQFLSANAQVRAAVEQAIPQLREALEEQGISLSEAMVGEHAGGQQGEMAFANGGGNGQAGGQPSDDDLAEDDRQATPARPLDLDGRVDLYA
ncbi:flagellar hook-length control protein FliK [Halomonas sp. ML-15]|uniref:flagellar hook-length control protein FliK n=1 Tax=Halomonas sp. ML-15 TaxID=2773305 RepID=UPI001746EF67|nr:flagellar hook-length control protein FliK [Halomonas sp. ML-15]MBD3895224.1 flagellar hook-length control protein FliK [Halomonas sp. ML-15]